LRSRRSMAILSDPLMTAGESKPPMGSECARARRTTAAHQLVFPAPLEPVTRKREGACRLWASSKKASMDAGARRGAGKMDLLSNSALVQDQRIGRLRRFQRNPG